MTDEAKKIKIESLDDITPEVQREIMSRLGIDRTLEEQRNLSHEMTLEVWRTIDRAMHDMLAKYSDGVGFVPVFAACKAASEALIEGALKKSDQEQRESVELTSALMYHLYTDNQAGAAIIREELQKRALEHFKKQFNIEDDE